MKILQITARNIIGAREVKITPDKITLVTGDNGTCKSTTATVLQQAFRGGNLAKFQLLEDGPLGVCTVETEPEIVAVVGDEDGTERIRIHRQKGNKLEVQQRVGDSQLFKPVKKPQEFLDNLIDADGINPVTFLDAFKASNDRELIELILQALDIHLDRVALHELLGEDLEIVAEKDRARLASLHPVDEIAGYRLAIYEARTKANEKANDKQATSDTLAAAIPAHIKSVDADLETARMSKELLLTDVTKQRGTIDANYEAAVLDANNTLAAAKQKAISRRDAAIAAANAAFNEECSVAVSASDAAISEANEARHEGRQSMAQDEADLATLTERITTLERDAKNAIEQRTNEKTAKRFAEEALTQREISKRLARVLEGLDDFRRTLTEHLPIDGLVITPDEVRLNGVPIATLNTAARVRLAVQLCLLRSKTAELAMICVDGAESLGNKTLGLLMDELEASASQSFIFIKTNDVLRIRDGETNEVVGNVEAK